jgi:hypothetical protein
MTFKQLLKGSDSRSNDRLVELFNELGNRHNVVWYPSSGHDFRDIHEIQSLQAHLGQRGQKNLFIHTDYYSSIMNEVHPGAVLRGGFDQNTAPGGGYGVHVVGVYELAFKNPRRVDYHINPNYASIWREHPENGRIYLVDIFNPHDPLNPIPVIFFLYENINFLDQVLLQHKIRISHFVKVREGTGLGGCGKSLLFIYSFLSVLGIKYLLVDNQPYDDDIPEVITPHLVNNPQLKMVDRVNRHYQIGWSGYSVTVLSVQYDSAPVDLDASRENTTTILAHIPPY